MLDIIFEADNISEIEYNTDLSKLNLTINS